MRADRLILFSVGILAFSFLAGYFLIRKATTFSWSYITNSVVLSVLFLTNAVRGIRPVGAIEGLLSLPPGPVTARLREAREAAPA